MNKIYILPLVLMMVLLGNRESMAQCNTDPCQIPSPFTNAQDACILPDPSALDCYFGATFPSIPVSFPPSWCTTIENNHFFAFTADATTAVFDICTYGCAQGGAIQAAVLATADCITFTFVSPCLGNIPSGSCQTLTASNLVPGQNYYLMIDGSAGAQCDYSINGVNPTINGPTAPVCLPSPNLSNYSTNTISTWTINPPSAGNIIGNPTSQNIAVQWLQPGPAEVCAQSILCPNAPNLCLQINIGEAVSSTEMVEVCQGYTVQCAGQNFSNGGTFPVRLTNYLGCDSTVNCVVSVIPTVFSTEIARMCQGGSTTCAGEEFYTPGTFPVRLQAWQGCDSVVNCVVQVVPTTFSPTQFVSLCAPAEYQVCDEIYNETGIYTTFCTGYLGCDSIRYTDLAIMDPVAVIAPPAILDCGANITVTLDGTGSSVNNATGGVTLYFWSGPGIVGSAITPTITVNQPGEYCLVVRHSRAGVFCQDTTCVTVLQNAGIPQQPVLTGFQTPCAGMTLVYSATATGNPPPTAFNWTLPGNHPYTDIPPSSIEVTWLQGTPTGQLCVTAVNSCGASPQACIPLSVGDQPLLPVISGPSVVCSEGGNYPFLLDTVQMGTQYFWTVPPGAVLNNIPGGIGVNFANASSGQVCVTAQNGCDTLSPVCVNVQVVPNPTASLSATPDEICLGDSLVLTFTLTGNPQFEVVWSDGTQNFTNTGFNLVNQRTVSPTVNTTYTLISVSDGSTPACTTVVMDTVEVRVWPLDTVFRTLQICDGDSILLGGSFQYFAGTYRDTLSNINGCDSIIVSALIVNPIDTTIVDLTTCDPAAVGTVTEILTQFNGCDSVVITNTSLLPSNLTEIFGSSCDLANVGVFTQNLLNQFGCDSTVITTIIFSDSDTTYLSATTCDPLAVGVFEELLVASSDGCDSLVITTVTLLPSNTTALSGQSCNPAEVGVFVQVLSNQFGCDSTVTTTITFNGIPPTPQSATTCNASEAGVFTNIIVTPEGCDSAIVTTVTFVPLPPTPLTATTCDPAAVGVFADTVLTAAGCDSILITTVSLLPSSSTDLFGQSCNPAEVGVFVEVFPNQFGCDSTVTTTITFNGIPPTPQFATTCNANEAGVFTNIIVTPAGCDSAIVTTVTFVPLPPTPLTATTCDPAGVGVFADTVLTAAGCDSILVTTVSLLPSSVTNLTAQSCDPSQVGVFVQNLTNQFGCDSTVTTTVTLLPSNVTNIALQDCNPANVGVFTQDLTNQFGCDSTVITTVTLLPSNTTAFETFSCDPASVGIFVYPLVNQFGCDSIVTETVTLLPSSATTVQLGTCEPGQVGTVVNVLTNQFGCDSTVTTITSLLPPASCGMTANLAGSIIPCGMTTGTLTLTVTLGEGPFNYTVLLGNTPVSSGTINSVDVPQTVSGLAPGNYTVNYSSANGFSASAQATIVQLVPPVLTVSQSSNYGGFGVSCPDASDGSASATATGGLPPYSFAWSSGAATPQANDLTAGIFTVTVTDANNCTTTGTVSLNEPAPLQISFIVNDPKCFGNSNGSISVSATGGAQPYRFVLNNGAPQASSLFTGLAAGAYTVTAYDLNDCETSEIIVINTPLPLSVDLGEDISIELGESAVLQAIVNIPFDSLASVVWNPLPETSECPQCLSQEVFPVFSTTYSIQVVDNNGCRAQDQIIVKVDRRRHVYIPNVFTPNDDGDNDKFQVYPRPNTVRKIRYLSIFDRWGENLYYADNYLPEDTNIGWDGNYKGQPMNPGVYVWVVEIEFMDGEVELYKGDVTIVR